MYSDYYVIGGCIIYIILVGICAYHCSNFEDKGQSCLLCFNKEEEDEYKRINV
jgi:hypothetical protein